MNWKFWKTEQTEPAWRCEMREAQEAERKRREEERKHLDPHKVARFLALLRGESA